MNPLEPIAHFIDPVDRYLRKQAGALPSLSDIAAATPGARIEIAGPLDGEGIGRVTRELIERGGVHIHTPHQALAARLVRFWTGSGVIDIVISDRDGRSRRRGVSRIVRSQFRDLDPVVLTQIVSILTRADPSTAMYDRSRPGGQGSETWVPSPGPWVPPAGVRPALNWTPPQGISPRIDAMRRWARLWYRTPFLDRSAHVWMWHHGFWWVPASGPDDVPSRQAE